MSKTEEAKEKETVNITPQNIKIKCCFLKWIKIKTFL